MLSDIHLETPKAYDVFEIVPKAPYLALLGDIGNIARHKDDCLAFLTKQLQNFRVVLFCPGNHEAYHSNWSETLDILRAFEQDSRENNSLGDFVLLDRAAFRLPDANVIVLGCSLFSCGPPQSETAVSFGLNDFYHTDAWDVSEHNEAHKRDLAWLNAQVTELEQSDSSIIILTHWSPTVDDRAIDPKHANSAVKTAFMTDLSDEACFNSNNVKVWAFGHTHYNCDFMVTRKRGTGPIRLLTNQRGYYFAQAEGFDAEKTIGA
ncbi:MAG: hypothetical protein Q9159_007116 [Coniocarpon cinnabarinum]